MSVMRARAAGGLAFLASAAMVGLMCATPANAVVGTSAKDGSYPFTVKLDIGGQRSCSGSLVEQQWVLTAASCFADNPKQSFKVTPGAPKFKTTATIGRADLTRESGSVMNVVELVPREDRDLVMAKLENPVVGAYPATISSNAPLQGEDLWSAGYGRTKDEWVPDHLHYAKFSVGSVNSTAVSLTGTSGDAVLCQGDTGAPAFRDVGGRYEIVGVNNRSWQGGCLGNEAETRTGAVDTRVDDLADWIQQTSSRTLLPRANWKNADLLASGYFTGGSAGGKRRMDMVVRWADGSVTLYQGADHSAPEYPFSAEYKLADAGSTWKHARAITGGSFTGNGSDGMIVRWSDGELTEYTHVDQKGFHDEKTLRPAGTKTWENAKLITAGRYTANSLRDDLLVVWADGSASMYPDIDTKGLSGWTQLQNAGTWNDAAQIGAGEFAGGKTGDLMIRWSDGDTTIFPAVDTSGTHGRTRIRDPKSAWINAQVMTVGSFTTANGRPNDILIRWANGPVSYYPGVDLKGTHGEVQLIN